MSSLKKCRRLSSASDPKLRQAFKSPMVKLSQTGNNESDLSHHDNVNSAMGSDSNNLIDTDIPNHNCTNAQQCVKPVQTPKSRRSQPLFRTPFRSPVPHSCSPLGLAVEECLTLHQMREQQIDHEISELTSQGYSVDELQGHIDRLHRYNDIKDTAQVVMGRLAELEEVTLREIHLRYAVPSEEI